MGEYFTLGFTAFNIVMSFLMIAGISWFIYSNYHLIEDALKEKLLGSLNRIFDGASRQPLYDVFYGLHHPSIDAWVTWIKTQKAKKQERAFRRLVDHLLDPPKELGSITKEVVRAVILFEHDDSFETLAQLLANSREKWGVYKALNQFYGDAAIGLVELDPEQAEEFLKTELSLASNALEADSLKLCIITALTYLPNPEKVAEVFKEIIVDGAHSPKIKMEVLNLIERNEPESFQPLLELVIIDLLENAEDVDQEMLTYCFDRFIADLSEESAAWELVIKVCQSQVYGDGATLILSERIKLADFPVNSESLYTMLQTCSGRAVDYLRLALEQRFALSNEEREILTSADEINKISLDDSMPDEILSLEDCKNLSFHIPDFLKDNHKKVEDLLNPRSGGPGIRLITGDSPMEKYFLARTCASSSKRDFIFVDAKKMILSPDKMGEFEALVDDHKPCIIYLSDIQTILEPIDDKAERRKERFLSMLRKYYKDSRVSIVASLEINSDDLRDDHPLLFEKIKVIPNDDFAMKINMGALSAKQKKKIFSHYELKLDEEREVCLDGIDEVLDSTEGFSNIKFLHYLLQYMKSSLLTHGKLISLSSYNRLVGAEEAAV